MPKVRTGSCAAGETAADRAQCQGRRENTGRAARRSRAAAPGPAWTCSAAARCRPDRFTTAWYAQLAVGSISTSGRKDEKVRPSRRRRRARLPPRPLSPASPAPTCSCRWSAGRPGSAPSNWYTTVWIHNPGTEAATATVCFLAARHRQPDAALGRRPRRPRRHREARERRRDATSTSRRSAPCASPAPTQRLVVTSRVYSQGRRRGRRSDSVGQDFAGVPASFAIGLGEKTQILGVHQTLPAADSEFRFNFGFVETTGHTPPPSASARSTTTAPSRGSRTSRCREYSQRQVAFKDHFPTAVRRRTSASRSR